jgi:hypothetical protein
LILLIGEVMIYEAKRVEQSGTEQSKRKKPERSANAFLPLIVV